MAEYYDRLNALFLEDPLIDELGLLLELVPTAFTSATNEKRAKLDAVNQGMRVFGRKYNG